MPHLFLVIALLCSQLLGVFTAFSAPAESLVVQGELVLTKASSPYVFQSIIVPVGAILRVEAGVNLEIEDQGEITVDGGLIVEGTEGNPTVVTGSAGKDWKQFTASPGAHISIQHAQLRNFTLPIHLETGLIELSDILIEDGQNNTVEIGGEEVAITGVVVHDLTFRNEKRGEDMQNIGLIVEGKYSSLSMSNIIIDDMRQVRYPTLLAGIKVTHTVTGPSFTEVNNLVYSRGCRFTNGNSTTKQFILVADLRTCPQTIPTLFVPGYGTSINMGKLTARNDRSPTSDGWHFVPSLTSSYFSLLESLQSTGATYKVAYYDWRLPVEQIVNGYLLPAINDLRKNGARQVNIVAHSFGGVIARYYIQNSAYRYDVAQFIEIGTPNLGAAKAYNVWQGALLPKEWSVLQAIIRLYGSQERARNLSDVQVIHEYFPSVQSMLPNYPAISFAGNIFPPDQLVWQNYISQSLSENVTKLIHRTRVTSIFSATESTLNQIVVHQPNATREYWPDGEALPYQPFRSAGDGTVVWQSAKLPNVAFEAVSGGHADLPAAARKAIVQRLYPAKVLQISPFQDSPQHVFVFDCPIEVEITLPSGEVRSTRKENGKSTIGWVEKTDDLILMVLPEMSGSYQIEVTALADTPVRYWVDTGSVQEFVLQKDEKKQVIFTEVGAVPTISTPAFSSSSPLPEKSLAASSSEEDISQIDVLFPSFKFLALPPFQAIFWPALVIEEKLQNAEVARKADPKKEGERQSMYVPNRNKRIVVLTLIVIGGLIIFLQKRRE